MGAAETIEANEGGSIPDRQRFIEQVMVTTCFVRLSTLPPQISS
jgi:hypothetical protein